MHRGTDAQRHRGRSDALSLAQCAEALPSTRQRGRRGSDALSEAQGCRSVEASLPSRLAASCASMTRVPLIWLRRCLQFESEEDGADGGDDTAGLEEGKSAFT